MTSVRSYCPNGFFNEDKKTTAYHKIPKLQRTTATTAVYFSEVKSRKTFPFGKTEDTQSAAQEAKQSLERWFGNQPQHGNSGTTVKHQADDAGQKRPKCFSKAQDEFLLSPVLVLVSYGP